MLLDAITHYFAGERREMFIIISGSLLLTLAAVALFLGARDSFAKAFLVAVVLSASLLSATAGWLLVRDADMRSSLVEAVESNQLERVVGDEQARIEDVISKYRFYRYGAALLAAAVVATLLASRASWTHGAAAGLLLLITAQVAIDHYSERRATGYLSALFAARKDAVVKPAGEVPR